MLMTHTYLRDKTGLTGKHRTNITTARKQTMTAAEVNNILSTDWFI